MYFRQTQLICKKPRRIGPYHSEKQLYMVQSYSAVVFYVSLRYNYLSLRFFVFRRGTITFRYRFLCFALVQSYSAVVQSYFAEDLKSKPLRFWKPQRFYNTMINSKMNHYIQNIELKSFSVSISLCRFFKKQVKKVINFSVVI